VAPQVLQPAGVRALHWKGRTEVVGEAEAAELVQQGLRLSLLRGGDEVDG